MIKDIINISGRKFYFILDCEYIAPGAWRRFAEKAIKRIEKIDEIIPNVTFVIVSSSFPNKVSDIGGDDEDSFPINEISLFLDVIRSKKSASTILYGDYGSINPIRNDTVVMSRGWIPRIDVALRNEIFYYRERRGTLGDYSSTYSKVAKKIVVDTRFPSTINNNWGIQQILKSSKGDAPGSTPSFWISVRMNIHIEQQLIRLTSLIK